MTEQLLIDEPHMKQDFEQGVAPEEGSDNRIVLDHLLITENPKVAFEEIQLNNPEQIGAILGLVEQDLGIAGADMRMGVVTKEDREKYASASSAYERFVTLLAANHMERADRDGVSEQHAKRQLVDMLVTTTSQVHDADMDFRFSESSIERFRDKIALGRVRKIMARIAIAGGMGLAGYGAAKGIDVSAETFQAASGMVGFAIGASVSLGKGMFNGIKGVVGGRIEEGLDKYDRRMPSDTDKPTKMDKDQFKVHEYEVVHDDVDQLEADLYRICGKHIIGEDISSSELVEEVVGLLMESFDDYYGFEQEKTGSASTLAIGAVEGFIENQTAAVAG